MKKAFFILWVCLFFNLQLQAQRIFVNTNNALFELIGGAGSCNSSNTGPFCMMGFEGIFSSALFKDTLYYISNSNNNLYRVKLGVPSSCTYLTSFPISGPFAATLNGLTVDKNGILYAVDLYTNDLYRYNPYTDQKQLLGQVPSASGGDLIFFNDKLLLSTSIDGIYEINLANPAASQRYMTTGIYQFFGLISFPFQCERNKVYGFSPRGAGTELVELDLYNRTVIGVVCTLPYIVWDGASVVENGSTIGISIDSILAQPACNNNAGSVKIVSFSASAGALTYTLDNSITNGTGIFTNVSLGPHQVRITNEAGCTKDSSFVMTAGLSDVQLSIVHPLSCNQQNGAISVQAPSGIQPLTFSLNNGPPQSSNVFSNLGAGQHTITVRDAVNCRRDTTITLNYQSRPDYISTVTTTATICESKTGSIHIQMNGNTTGITVSLNNGPPQQTFNFNNLAAGQYLISISNASNCRYDTTLSILQQSDPRPAINIFKEDQLCNKNNGMLSFTVNGPGAPFEFNLNNTGFSNTSIYSNLFPGNYRITIRNSNFCFWDTSVVINPYIIQPVTIAVDKTQPGCNENKGQIRVNATGNQSPYFLQWNNQLYPNGTTFTTDAGEFIIPVLNKDNCPVDSARVRLDIIVSPNCDSIFMPNAFSPNGDGKNEVFRPVYGVYIKKVNLAIYNRYGQLVFRNASAQHGWDGTVNGSKQSAGTYVWVLSYENSQGIRKNMKGYVLLVR